MAFLKTKHSSGITHGANLSGNFFSSKRYLIMDSSKDISQPRFFHSFVILAKGCSSNKFQLDLSLDSPLYTGIFTFL